MDFYFNMKNGLLLYSNHLWPGWKKNERNIRPDGSIEIKVMLDPFLEQKGWNKIDILERGKKIVWYSQDSGNLTAIDGRRLELRYEGTLVEKYEKWIMGWGIAAILFQRGFLVMPGTTVQRASGTLLCFGNDYQIFTACGQAKSRVFSPLRYRYLAIAFTPEGKFQLYELPEPATKKYRDDYFPDLGVSKLLREFESFKMLFERCFIPVKHLNENLIVQHFRNVEKFLNHRKIYEINATDSPKILFAFFNTDPPALV